MRIISGEYRGKLIRQVKSKEVRSTQDRVKEALFNILGDKIKDSLFLDLFCGSGSIGLEACSRGAKKVIFVDREKDCINVVKKNISLIGLSESDDIIISHKDIFKFISHFVKYKIVLDIIFLDPPYYRNLVKKSLKKIISVGIINHSGIIVVEHHKKDKISENEGDWYRYDSREYGDTVLSFFKKR